MLNIYHEQVHISIRDAPSAADGVIHVRLCEGRLIQLIVTPATITDVVHDHILVESLTILQGYITGA